MAKYLVIVESPAKVKTIKKFLGKNYEVTASNGHVRDLPKSQMGIDVENDFALKYITIRGKGDILANLRKEAKKADVIYLATDPDREGEAISWHLAAALNLDEDGYKRITFNEITKTAVKASLKNSRKIDMSLVDAQQARRALDRLVGYEISPILWAKVKRGLSAGRVQSAALRIICDREDEINAFVPGEYWTIDASILAEGARKPLTAHFYGDSKGKIDIPDQAAAKKILSELAGADYRMKEIKKSTRTKKAPLPFTTSTLQQEASRHLNFSTQKTMRVAQQLYEGVHVKGHGSIGLITYLRTDSTRISQEADDAAREYIAEAFGAEYLPDQARKEARSGRVQDAHEAIRPTDIRLTPVQVKESLSRDQFRLYQLIWNRFAASRMAAASYETLSLQIGAGDYIFRVSDSRILFRGYLSVYALDEEKQEHSIPAGLSGDTALTLKELHEEQHFTQPPAHYTEASLVKALEDFGIGRPSTYAPTITTLLGRHYIVKEKKNLFVSELGEVVNQMMKDAFPEIVDPHFTANMESLLDSVEEGTIPWKTVIRNFYPDLEKEVVAAKEELERVEVKDEVSDIVCDKCGRHMVIKYGPHGKFLACPGFPDCRNTMPFLEKIGVSCPKCGKDLVLRRTKKGRRFYGCEDYPNCDFDSWQKPSAEKCPKCGSYMVERGKQLHCADPSCGYLKKKEG